MRLSLSRTPNNRPKNTVVPDGDFVFPKLSADRPVVYLGGGDQSGEPPWRKSSFYDLRAYEVTIIDPSPTVFPNPVRDPEGHAAFANWERAGIDAADIVVFWLGGTLANQAARVEIGYALARRKRLVLGADSSTLGREHIASFVDGVVAKSIDGLRVQVLAAVTHLPKDKEI